MQDSDPTSSTDGMDRIAQMLELQAELQTHAHPAYRDPRTIVETADKVQFIRDMREALESELQEAIDEISWKPWSQKPPFINLEAYKGELVDAWHFFMNMMLAVDMTADDLFQGYLEKHLRNRVRWAAEGGYQNEDKCPRCKRAWDDIRAHLSWNVKHSGVELQDGTRVCMACATDIEKVEGKLV